MAYIGYTIGWRDGRKYGRDEQFADDFIEQDRKEAARREAMNEENKPIEEMNGGEKTKKHCSGEIRVHFWLWGNRLKLLNLALSPAKSATIRVQSPSILVEESIR